MTGTLRRIVVTEAHPPRARRGDSLGPVLKAARRLLLPMGAPSIGRTDVALDHTPLGQPVVALQGALAQWAREVSIHPSDLQVSFSHDGEQLAALLATAPGLRGAGVDIVHLQRLARRSDRYLLALARRFMSPGEYSVFAQRSCGLTHDALVEAVASHFSLMEAVSKALGTGLRLGFGNGTRHSLALREIAVTALRPAPVLDLGPAALARCEAISAACAEGHIAIDGEYLRSEAYLWGSGDGRRGPATP